MSKTTHFFFEFSIEKSDSRSKSIQDWALGPAEEAKKLDSLQSEANELIAMEKKDQQEAGGWARGCIHHGFLKQVIYPSLPRTT